MIIITTQSRVKFSYIKNIKIEIGKFMITMLYNYISLIFFLTFAILIPVLFLTSSKMLRRHSNPNPIKNAPYESGEATVGSGRDIDVEYLPFFMVFLPFEIIAILILLWSINAINIPYKTDLEMIGLLSTITLLSILGYKYIGDRNR